jgi:import receptor subunit TOM70
MLNEFERAAEDYKRSSDLDPIFVLSHIQLAMAEYKMKNIDGSMAAFEETALAFPG